MKLVRNSTWTRRGSSLLWEPSALVSFAQPGEVVSLRQFVAMAADWPEELPSSNGRALVVAGVEGCLDALTSEDAATWIERDLRQRIFAFQDEYEDAGALVFWLPSGRSRLRYSYATGDYEWSGLGGASIPLGRLLWAGARSDAHRILTADTEPDGAGWAGMYHPRIS